LHLLFQNPESLIDIVIANEYLHVPSIRIVARCCSQLGQSGQR
jgi:hypothetical protein